MSLQGVLFHTKFGSPLFLLAEADAGEDGVVVRGVAADVLAVWVLRPVAVGADGIGVDMCGGADEDVVDALVGDARLLEIIPGAVLGKAQAGGFVAVLEQAGLGEDGVDLVVLVDVEVTGEDGQSLAFGHLLDALAYELGGLAAGHAAHVVHVEVEEDELLLGAEVEETSPGADADAGGIPSQGGAVWGLVEPEIPAVEQAHAFLFIKDCRIFAVLFAVVAPDADVVVAVEVLQHVANLTVEDFLSTEDFGLFPVEQVAEDLAAARPYFAADAVAVVPVADVVGPDGEFLGRGGERGQGKEDAEEGGLHDENEELTINNEELTVKN